MADATGPRLDVTDSIGEVVINDPGPLASFLSNVLDTRAALFQPFIHGQALVALARIGGVGFVSPEAPEPILRARRKPMPGSNQMPLCSV